MSAPAYEWQVAEGSSTLHVIDTAKPAPQRSGPLSLCKRRPQRNDGEWFALPVSEVSDPPPYSLKFCEDCRSALAEVTA